LFKFIVEESIMAVNKNPYKEWENLKSVSDYRCTDTQMSSLVRQQLSEGRFLRTSNRVNPGPYRNQRAKFASSIGQQPHPFGSEDLWGWQKWTEESQNVFESPLAENLLLPEGSAEVPGKDYSPFGEVHGASS
jgi:hypothetical protein